MPMHLGGAPMEPWVWLAAGILLCAAETFAPGLFLLWLGLAGIATGVFLFGMSAFGLGLGFAGTLLLFCGFAVVSVIIGKRFYGSHSKAITGSFLNRRMDAFVGQTFLLHDAIVNSSGRIRVGDSVWQVVGPDLPAGAKVRIIAVADDSVTLRVEAA